MAHGSQQKWHPAAPCIISLCGSAALCTNGNPSLLRSTHRLLLVARLHNSLPVAQLLSQGGVAQRLDQPRQLALGGRVQLVCGAAGCRGVRGLNGGQGCIRMSPVTLGVALQRKPALLLAPPCNGMQHGDFRGWKACGSAPFFVPSWPRLTSEMSMGLTARTVLPAPRSCQCVWCMQFSNSLRAAGGSCSGT